MDPDVVARFPGAVFVEEVFECFAAFGVFGDEFEAAFAAVAVWIGGDDAVAFHVGLSGEDEDFDGR